ncbi:unnamed protein product [Tilletia controversa]|uniref:Uncharacterized protein n=3 Tax=Tilletia TaxID=13289 RepID=A0A8X7MN78_9BASI|nr:hypothetical protein CF328_g6197 [Tilletia controversa]KAE8191936.1 hypothetical protein CF336_g4644 [Tilletia laevis]KAE8265107.1 hypothetical protein A4X03_0g488 [Tilletia caries]KAE8200894.1 hypothetical protein CF335_g3859 [Tilletia laevis]KAE8242836.1 hypothetical protein A4X06_0g6735 [Tilletia controversa]
MDTRGGFVLPREGEPQLLPSLHAHSHEGEAPPLPPRPLTDRQQTRLSAYLDEAFGRISRGFLRRHEPRPERADGEAKTKAEEDADWLPTLHSLLAAWASVLGLIARVPPLGSSAPLLVSLLLRATSELTENISGYNLGEHGALHDLDTQLHAALALVDALDSIWADLLRGQAIDQHQARLQLLTTSPEAPPSSDTQYGLSTDPSGRFHHSQVSRRSGPSSLVHSFPPPPSTPFADASTSSSTATSVSALSQTERIRLRNLALLARDRLFRWMRDVLDAPPPPETDDAQDEGGDSHAAMAILGNGPRVAALLAFDERMQRHDDDEAARRPGKRRRLEGEGGGLGGSSAVAREDDDALEEQEREFAELVGAQGDLDSGLPPVRDEPVDEPDDDDDDGVEELEPPTTRTRTTADGEELELEIEVVIDDDDDAPRDEGGGGGDGDALPGEDEGPLEQEHQHYADLFSRKLDPDASDDDDEPHDTDDHRKRTNANLSSDPPSSKDKRQRSGSIDSDDARTVDPSAGAGEESASRASRAVLGQWDLEFSRCFRRTLRLLAEQADRAQERERDRERDGD